MPTPKPSCAQSSKRAISFRPARCSVATLSVANPERSGTVAVADGFRGSKMRKSVLAALIAVVSVPAAAQQQGTATLYTKGHFAGASMTISAPTARMTPFTVESLRVAPGTVWELCSGNTFTGCERYSESQEAMVRTVRSVRPVAAPIPQSVGLPNAAVPGSNPSLRGLASEFFPMPALSGSRVEVAGGAGGEIRAATEFCRTRGWRMPAYQRVQAVSGKSFLADVLCVNEGN
jgi:hypothetical protein